MTGLFELSHASYPLAGIQRLGCERQTTDGITLRYLRHEAEEDAVQISGYEANRILQAPVQLLQAQPGTFVLWAWRDYGVAQVGKRAVIAWALCFDGEIRCVTPQGVNDGDGPTTGDVYVEMPDGSVQAQCPYAEHRDFDNVAAYLAHHQKVFDAEAGAGASA